MTRLRMKKRKRLSTLLQATRNPRKTKSSRKNPSNKKHEKPPPFDVLLQDEQPQQNQSTNLVLTRVILKIPKTTMKMNSTKTSNRKISKNKTCRCPFPRTDITSLVVSQKRTSDPFMIKSSNFVCIYFVPFCSFIQSTLYIIKTVFLNDSMSK